MSMTMYEKKIDYQIMQKASNKTQWIKKQKNHTGFKFMMEDDKMIAENLYECYEGNDNCCMVKIYSKSDFEEKELDNFLKVLHYIQNNCNDHPNLIKILFYTFNTQKDLVYVIYERLPNLTSKTNNIQPNLLEVQEFMYQMAMTIRFLHENGIALSHLDQESVVMLKNNDQNIYKIMDFRYAYFYRKQNDLTICQPSLNNAAPEIINNRQSSVQSDVYCLGMLVCQFIDCYFSIDNLNYYLDQFSINYGPNLKSMISKMLEQDPKLRITSKQLFYEPFFSELHRIIFLKNLQFLDLQEINKEQILNRLME